MKEKRKLLFWAIVAALLTSVVLSGTLWGAANLQFSGTSADSAKIIGSVIVLVGTLFTAAVTLVGLVLKHSLDAHNAEIQRLESTRNLELKAEAENRFKLESQRNLELKDAEQRRLALDSERSLQLNNTAEERLKLEVAIRAFELFKTAAASRASATEACGALFALTKLGHVDLALQLLKQLWPRGAVDSSSAVWVINNALEADSRAVQEEAAELLRANAEKLPDGKGGQFWPGEPEKWKAELSLSVRVSLLEALLLSLMSREIDYWDQHYLAGTVLPLSAILETDSSPHVRIFAALALEELLRLKALPQGGVVDHGTRHVDLRILRQQVKKLRTTTGWRAVPMQEKLGRRLQEWVKQEGSEHNGVIPRELTHA